ncbi:MAG: helix-turn-helix transcriptional regulator [Solirubrobacterales bacterium]|nr:helix-turn-helix transcriptional regulator [Solirubrobacterales bacterium]
MRSGDVIRIARDRAGLTQQQLASRSGRPRETIARWESGRQAPSLEAVSALVAECGLDLVLRLTENDTTLTDRVREQLGLSPPKRLARLLPRETVREARRSLRWLADARTPTIVLGQVGAALLGAPQRPDIAQVEFVAEDPLAMDRELRAAGLAAVDVEDRWREVDVREPWTLQGGGTLALARNVPGTGDYRDLKRSASHVDFDARTRVLVAHPRDLLRIADASTRESEHARAPGLQALLEVSYA